MNLCRPKNILHLENLFDNVILPQATTQQMIFCPQKVWSKKKKKLLLILEKKKNLLFFFDQTFQPQIFIRAIEKSLEFAKKRFVSSKTSFLEWALK